MRREDVMAAALETLAELGIPAHISSVARVSARLEIRVVIAGQMKVIPLRSGIPPAELKLKLDELRAEWELRDFRAKQVDLEEIVPSS